MSSSLVLGTGLALDVIVGKVTEADVLVDPIDGWTAGEPATVSKVVLPFIYLYLTGSFDSLQFLCLKSRNWGKISFPVTPSFILLNSSMPYFFTYVSHLHYQIKGSFGSPGLSGGWVLGGEQNTCHMWDLTRLQYWAYDSVSPRPKFLVLPQTWTIFHKYDIFL